MSFTKSMLALAVMAVSFYTFLFIHTEVDQKYWRTCYLLGRSLLCLQLYFAYFRRLLFDYP